MGAKKWESCAALAPADTIAGLEFSRRNLLSCIAWDGSLSIVDPLNPVSVYKTTLSRPLFAQSWEPEGHQLWFGGAEERISCLNLDKMVTTDYHPGDGTLLALQVVETMPQTLVAADETATYLLDTRIPSETTHIWQGTRSVDVQNNLVLATNGDRCAMFDLRNLGSAVRDHALVENASALNVKWLDNTTYALADKCSRVHIYSLVTNPFAFYSNRLEGSTISPIYALASSSPGQLATGGGDHYVYVWDYQRRSLRTKLRFPMPCMAIAYSRWGNLLAVGLSNDDWSVTNAQYARPSRAKVVFAHTS